MNVPHRARPLRLRPECPDRHPERRCARREGDLGPLSNLLMVDLERAALVMAVYALLFGVLLFWSFTRRDIA